MNADSRVDLHLPRATKLLIERAATIENTSVSEFVVGNALRAALQTIADDEAREMRHAEHLAAIEIFHRADETPKDRAMNQQPPGWEEYPRFAPGEPCVVCGKPVSGKGTACQRWPHKIEHAHWPCIENDDG